MLSSETDRSLASHILRAQPRPLDAFFTPQAVAVIGATETPGAVGRTVLWNLVSNPFGGTVFPVNPRRPSVLGIKAYPRMAEVPAAVDLAVIATPAPTVPGAINDCIAAGVRAAVILSAGFREIGTSGLALEEQIRTQLQGGKMRLIGPNCLGIMCPRSGLNATFAAPMARLGNVAFLSQSGALLTAILDWSLQAHVGFSTFCSLGSMLDVGWGDLIDYLTDDPHTNSIVLYMESIGDARAFLSAARAVTLRKPVIVIKAGRTEAASQAAASHTGALTGSDEVLDAAFRRCGVLRVSSIGELFSMAEVLSKQPRPKGPRLTILTNAGGPGVLAADALIANGGRLTALSEPTQAALNELLPPQWSHNNPIDVLGDADPDRYARAVEIAAGDPSSDGLLVILTPQAITDPTRTAEKLRPYARQTGKPVLASWMGGATVAAGTAILNQADIPTFAYPEAAAHAFTSMWRYSYILRGLYETPILPSGQEDASCDRARATEIIQAALQAGRTLLSEHESKQLLAAHGIPTVPTRIAATEVEAAQYAQEMGYPVVLKLHSLTISHKTDVGGVRLNLLHEAAVRQAFQQIRSAVTEKAGAEHFVGVTVQPMCKIDGYELILGSSIDAQLGPVLLFGAGGQMVEVFKDRSLALPLLNTTLARRMMEQTRIYAALQGVRGRQPVDLAALEMLLTRFSQLVVEQPRIREIEVNPLLASPERLLALDARIVLFGSEVADDQLPRPAIRPYPSQYIRTWSLADGTAIRIRPIRPEDEPLLVKLHEKLSEQSVYLRFFHRLKLSQRVAHERLSRLCFIDYDREMALVAEHRDAETRAPEVLAVCRLIKEPGLPEAEWALLVSDPYQGKGLGTRMLQLLLEVARAEKLARLYADILPENRGMIRICQKLGFHLEHDAPSRLVKAQIHLDANRNN